MNRVFNLSVETDNNCMVTAEIKYTYKCIRCGRINQLLEIPGFALAVSPVAVTDPVSLRTQLKHKRTLRIEPVEFTSECRSCRQKEVIRTKIHVGDKEVIGDSREETVVISRAKYSSMAKVVEDFVCHAHRLEKIAAALCDAGYRKVEP